VLGLQLIFTRDRDLMLAERPTAFRALDDVGAAWCPKL
jgi:hypothetical protein